MIHKINLSLLFLIVGLLATRCIAQQQREATSLVGTYSAGHSFGFTAVTLKADGSYAMESRDCTMEYFRSGTYVSSSGVLHFKILKDVAKGHGADREINLLDPIERKVVFGNYSGGIATEFELIPIRWSDRIYLISEDDLRNFTDAVNFGLEPRAELSSEPYMGSFYLREGDEKKRVSGAPGVPGKWSSLLLRRPVVATIVALRSEAKEILATINKGSKSGLRVGMRVLAKNDEPSAWSGYKVLSVTKKSAVIQAWGGVTVGDKLSTKYESRIYR